MLQMYLLILDSPEEECKFRALYYSYSKLLHYVARGILKDDMLAEDAVQETFIRVAKNFAKVGAVDCPQTRKFLVVIVRRVSLTMLDKREPAEADEAIETRTAEISYEQYQTQERYADVVDNILMLSETYKQVLYLHYVFQYTAAEIANLLELPVETVKKRIQRGKKIVMDRVAKGADPHE